VHVSWNAAHSATNMQLQMHVLLWTVLREMNCKIEVLPECDIRNGNPPAQRNCIFN